MVPSARIIFTLFGLKFWSQEVNALSFLKRCTELPLSTKIPLSLCPMIEEIP